LTAAFLSWVSALLYGAATAGYLVFLIRQNPKAARAAVYVFGAGFAVHLAAVGLRTAVLGQLPVLNLGDSFGFFSLVLAGGYLLVSWRYRQPAVGVLASPLTLGLLIVSLLLPVGPRTAGPLYMSLWLTLHLAAVFGGYGCFGLAFLSGCLYLVQENRIKAKRLGPITRRLPSLSVLDEMNHRCLVIGFFLLTLGIITGAALAQTAFGAWWRWDPKEVWTLISWLIYAALLHQRVTVGWRGRRAAILSILGFAVIGFVFLGVSLWPSSYHSFEGLERLRVQ
jgi:cytochrome c-type biogenesis protein CcsB